MKIEKNVSIATFKNLLNQADAISIDESPMLTNWKLRDDDSLINTRWNEDDLEYSCVIDDIDNILANENGLFLIYHDLNRATSVRLFSIKTIGL